MPLCSEITMYFISFLYSLIAALGLVENNAVVLVASMLVSPLMVQCYICFLKLDVCL